MIANMNIVAGINLHVRAEKTPKIQHVQENDNPLWDSAFFVFRTYTMGISDSARLL